MFFFAISLPLCLTPKSSPVLGGSCLVHMTASPKLSESTLNRRRSRAAIPPPPNLPPKGFLVAGMPGGLPPTPLTLDSKSWALRLW